VTADRGITGGCSSSYHRHLAAGLVCRWEAIRLILQLTLCHVLH